MEDVFCSFRFHFIWAEVPFATSIPPGPDITDSTFVPHPGPSWPDTNIPVTPNVGGPVSLFKKVILRRKNKIIVGTMM